MYRAQGAGGGSPHLCYSIAGRRAQIHKNGVSKSVNRIVTYFQGIEPMLKNSRRRTFDLMMTLIFGMYTYRLTLTLILARLGL